MAAPRVFDFEHYELLNRARGGAVRTLLDKLKRPLRLKTAIDVGCGLGYFSHFLKSLGFEVTAIDGRQQNVDEAHRRNPDIRFLRLDAEDPAIRSLGRFDLVLCFGLLYHLENPLFTIRHLQAMTFKLLLIEGVIFPGDEPIMGLIDESSYEDQGLNHIAFYPTEACLIKMLYRSGFPNVYKFTRQPEHLEYHQTQTSRRTRTMLAASPCPLDLNLLSAVPEPSSKIRPWDPRDGIHL